MASAPDDISRKPPSTWDKKQIRSYKKACKIVDRRAAEAKELEAAEAKRREAAEAQRREAAEVKRRQAAEAQRREAAEVKRREAAEAQRRQAAEAKAQKRAAAAATNPQTPAAPDHAAQCEVATKGWTTVAVEAVWDTLSSLFRVLLPSLRFIFQSARRLLFKAVFIILTLLAFVALVGALGAWFWTKAGFVPGVHPALNLLFTAVKIPFGFHTVSSKGAAGVDDVPQTDVILSPYMVDMNRGITYLSFVSGNGDTSGVASAVVDEALGENGLLGAEGIPATSKLSSVGKVLFDISKPFQDMGSQGSSLQEQLEEALTNSYREAHNILQALADAKERPSDKTMWGRTSAMLGVPWERMSCWLRGQSPAHRRLERHLGRFQRMLDEATGAQQQMADAFNNKGGGSVLSDLAGLVQTKLCRLDDALAQAVRVGGHALLQAQKKATNSRRGGQGDQGDQGDRGRGQPGEGETTETKTDDQGRGELAQADVAVIETASRELRHTQAIGATLCYEARKTTAGLTARRDAVLDLRRALGRIQARLAKKRAAVEDAVRQDACLEAGAVEEEEDDLRGMVDGFLKTLEAAYVA